MTIIQQMINKYDPKTIEDKKSAMKEVLQEVVLAGLSKTDFFTYAAFYGGTALRIFYGMDRFSEDLDFSLLVSDETFDISKYLKPISETMNSLGLHFEVSKKAAVEFITKLLSVFDDLETAERELKNEGLSLTMRKLRDVLRVENVEKIQVLGKKFDPSFMECVEAVEDKRSDYVVREVKPGYTIFDKIIRVAQVIVGKKRNL